MKRVAIGFIFAGFVIGSNALADTPPTIWDRARDPEAGRREALHAFVEQAMMTPTPTEVLREVALERARELLEAADAEHSSDVRLRFDLGEIYERTGRNERAIAVLVPAIKAAPNAPGVAAAIEEMAYAYARLDRPREEREAYYAYLAVVTDEPSRATATLNLAEAEMRLRNLPEAVLRYREAFDLASVGSNSAANETEALATWGLAVALDRSGDPQGAEREAKLGTQLDRNEALIAHGETVFFVPEYERLWYIALALAEEAKAATEPHAVAKIWKQCEQLWIDYLAKAAPTEPWLGLARAHLDKVKKIRALAEARAAKAPKPPDGFELYFP